MAYKFQGPDREDGVLRYSDNLYIPADSDNRHWLAFEAWEAQGNTADPWQNDQDIYDAEIQKTNTEQLKATDILQQHDVQDNAGLSTLDPATHANVVSYAAALEAHRMAVQTAGVGGTFPPFPVYPGGGALPTLFDSSWG